MSKKYNLCIVGLFCLFIGGFFLANLVAPTQAFSPMENRALGQMPTLSVESVLSAQFMKDFETYVTDQFVGRDGWIALKSTTEKSLGKQENNGVYLCEKDTLISRFDKPLDDRAKNLIDKNYGYVNKLAAKAGVPVYFSLIPGKVSAWADRLPEGAPNDDEYAYILRGEETDAKWIDSYGPLMAHRNEDIYYRTDHHWTSLGAYYGYAAIAQGMGFSPTPLTDYTKTVQSTEFFGSTFSSSGVRWVKPDTIETYVPGTSATVTNYFDVKAEPGTMYDLPKLAVKDKYAMFFGGNKPLTVIKSTVAPKEAPKLLVIRDSYSDSMAPFLTANFSEIHLFDPRYYKISPTKYAADHHIDQILVLYSVANFVSDGNLFVLGL
ncbi:MAG: DHHW family protein [Oscillospiraceae bacterium]